MNEKMMKEFKLFREQVYTKLNEFEEILRGLNDANTGKINMMAAAADDQMAARAVDLYQPFDAVVGTKLKKGTRVVFNGILYKYKGDTSTEIVATWNPVDAASIWEAINIDHAGTAEDPIPWAVNMQCYNGKYYTFDNVLYLCIRDSGIALAYTPDQLLGNYFNVA